MNKLQDCVESLVKLKLNNGTGNIRNLEEQEEGSGRSASGMNCLFDLTGRILGK